MCFDINGIFELPIRPVLVRIKTENHNDLEDAYNYGKKLREELNLNINICFDE